MSSGRSRRDEVDENEYLHSEVTRVVPPRPTTVPLKPVELTRAPPVVLRLPNLRSEVLLLGTAILLWVALEATA